MEELINRVANSGIITINLEDHYPKFEIVDFDLKDYLFHGLILKEKDFREALKNLDWAKYNGTVVAVHCSTDAIIPVWAYMLVASHATPFAKEVFTGTKEEYIKTHYNEVIDHLDITEYEDERIVVKGCSHKPVPPSAYARIMHKLHGHAQSVMYGEPCSTVPIFKRPRKL